MFVRRPRRSTRFSPAMEGMPRRITPGNTSYMALTSEYTDPGYTIPDDGSDTSTGTDASSVTATAPSFSC
jgi:hypothetical protein